MEGLFGTKTSYTTQQCNSETLPDSGFDSSNCTEILLHSTLLSINADAIQN